MSTIHVQVSLPCESCFARPCGEDDIVCVECRASIKARVAGRKTLSLAERPTVAACGIVSEPYDCAGTPGRACLDCHSAWPANEPEAHAPGCPATLPAPALSPLETDAVLHCLLAYDLAVAS